MWLPFYLFLRLLLLVGRWGHSVTYELYTRWPCSRRAYLRRAAKVILDDLPRCPICETPRWPEFMGRECQFCAANKDITESLMEEEMKSIPRHRLDIWFSPN